MSYAKAIMMIPRIIREVKKLLSPKEQHYILAWQETYIITNLNSNI